MAKTILGIGAHYDDCPFGIPGILLKAVRKNHRVVLLSLIGDYTKWKPARGRANEIVDGTIEICRSETLPTSSIAYSPEFVLNAI